eukprot:5995189-Alexandrium_andersonii.AAC.1
MEPSELLELKALRNRGKVSNDGRPFFDSRPGKGVGSKLRGQTNHSNLAGQHLLGKGDPSKEIVLEPAHGK